MVLDGPFHNTYGKGRDSWQISTKLKKKKIGNWNSIHMG